MAKQSASSKVPATIECLPHFNIRVLMFENLQSVRGLFLILCCLIVQSYLPAQVTNQVERTDPPKITIPKLAGPITIDGNFNEHVWKRAAVISSFRPNDGSQSKQPVTELRLWYDDTALFLGWYCEDQSIQATLTNRDDRLWEEDVVEFFVTPDKLTRYFEFQWSPLNTGFDGVVTNYCDELGISSGYRFDPAFTAAGLKSAVQITKRRTPETPGGTDGWQIEAAIPFADLGQATPQPGEIWRANFFRIDHGTNQPPEHSSWSPTRSPQFHHPNCFGYIEFGK